MGQIHEDHLEWWVESRSIFQGKLCDPFGKHRALFDNTCCGQKNISTFFFFQMSLYHHPKPSQQLNVSTPFANECAIQLVRNITFNFHPVKPHHCGDIIMQTWVTFLLLLCWTFAPFLTSLSFNSTPTGWLRKNVYGTTKCTGTPLSTTFIQFGVCGSTDGKNYFNVVGTTFVNSTVNTTIIRNKVLNQNTTIHKVVNTTIVRLNTYIQNDCTRCVLHLPLFCTLLSTFPSGINSPYSCTLSIQLQTLPHNTLLTHF